MPKKAKAFQLSPPSVFDVVANNDLALILTVLQRSSSATPTDSPKKEATSNPLVALLAPEQFAIGRDSGFFTPLHVACSHGHEEIVRVLLTNDAVKNFVDVNAVSDSNVSPIHCAALNGHKRIVDLLLDNGANPMIVNDNNDLPLHLAKRNCHSAIVVTLEPIYFDLFDPSSDPILALSKEDLLHFQLCSALCRDEVFQRGDRSHSSGADEDGNVVEPLHLKHTGSITSKLSFAADAEENSLLHLIALNKAPLSVSLMKITQCILQNQWYSSIDSKNVAGLTALHIAAENSHQALVELLLQYGASPLVPIEGKSETALALAQAPGTRAALKAATLKAELSVMLAGKNRVPLDERASFVSRAKSLKREIASAMSYWQNRGYVAEEAAAASAAGEAS